MPRKTKRLTMPRRKRTDLKLGHHNTMMDEETDFKGLDDVSDMLGALDFLMEEDKIKEEKKRITDLKKEEKRVATLIKEKEKTLKREEKLNSIAKNTSNNRVTRKMRKEIDKMEKKGEVLDLENLVSLFSNVSMHKGGKKHNKTVKKNKH
jgi:hypothetical protein